jgi:integrase
VWWLALTAGMRQGELLALRWPNVDLDNATVQVVASSIRLGKQARALVGWEDGDHQRLGEPKSRRSRRKIELSRPAVESLRRHRQKVMEAALASGRSFDRNGYVFSRVDGQALAVTSTWKPWGRLLKKAEVPYVRFHNARHTAATLLLSKGVHPKVVSEMLGHSTVAITLDVYSHVTASMHKEAAKVMDGIFAG